MVDKYRKQARELFVIGLVFSPAIVLVIIKWSANDSAGWSKLEAILLWALPAAVSIMCLALSLGRSITANAQERKENEELMKKNGNELPFK